MTPKSTRSVVAYLSGGHGDRIPKAFAEGCGAATAPARGGLVTGEAAVWGLLRGSGDLIRACERVGRRYYYIDHAYVARGHRQCNYRVAIDALQATAIIERPPDRWQRWQRDVKLQPWRTGGRHVLVCPPSEVVARFLEIPFWLKDVERELPRHTERPIVVRHKAQAYKRPLKADLENCHAVVTHQSMVAVEAVLAGVPVFTSHLSAAAPVATDELRLIEQPRRPDREPWLHHLAYCQFHLTELQDGTAWRILEDTIARCS